MGKRLYCFITGEGVLINWGKEKNLRNKTEEGAWEEAFKKKGVIINQNKSRKDLWQQIYNNWNNDNWGQIDSKVGLNGCIIWIKKKKKFNIDEKVKDTPARNIVNEIETKFTQEGINDINEIIILVHAIDGIDQQVTANYTTINQIPIKWYYYTTGGLDRKGGGMIDLVKIVINAIYSCNKLSNLCGELSKALEEAEKKIETSEQGKSLSLLKHQIVNILVPLRIDIDGLMEKNFDDEYWEKVSNYWRKKNLEGIFEDVNDIIKKSLEQKVLGQDVKSFVDLLSKKIAELKKFYKVAKLLTALETGDKKTVQNICKLYGNVYKIWMDELIDEFEKVKSNL